MMDFKEKETKPESTRKFLIHQAEEQSDLCDVTIKVGHWEKRFHRCVLIKSPFFDCVFKHDYKERHTGKIELKIGTPVTVEMALMFLYGKKPTLTTENAEILMTLAEFFLIPNLKAACVAWLKQVEVTDENCLKLLQVASLFDFEIPKCIEFVEGNLDSLLENEQFTDIDSDSIKYIFTEKKLSYISMDERLKFLIGWTQIDPIKRCERGSECVEFLNFNDIKQELLKEFSHDPLYRKLTGEKVIAETTVDKTNRHEVLVMKNESYGTSFWCLDLTRNKWFRLEATTSEDQTPYSFIDILGLQNTESTLYFNQRSYNENNVVFFDMETCLFQTLPVVQGDSGEALNKVDKIEMYAEVCILTEYKYVEIDKQMPKSDDELTLQSQVGLMNVDSMEQLLMLGKRKPYTVTTDIHIGLTVNNRIETKPLFTLKERVSKICMDNLYCIAFITDAKQHIIIYDFSECRMETVEETTTHSDKLSSVENGFVIFNKKRCIYLHRLQGPSHETKFQKKIIDFTDPGKEYSYIQMYFCKDRWYRYFKRSYEDDYQFECIAHSDLLASEHEDEVVWTPLPLPLEASKCDSGTLKQLFYVRLSKSKLRCDIECPHCEKMNKAKSKSRTLYHTLDIDDDFYNRTSSDEESNGYYGDGYGDNYSGSD